MEKNHKIKILLKAAIVFAIAVAFITPVTAIAPKAQYMKKDMNIPSNGNVQSRADSWVMQASGFDTQSRGINYISIVDANVVWAAGYDGSGGATPTTDYTRTTDGGNTWVSNTIPNTPGLDYSMIFAVSQNNAWACLYTASGGTQGIYATTDGGATWNRQTTADFNLAGSFPDCVHFWDANIGWCMGDPVDGYFEIYTTVNGGTTWTRVPQSDIPAPLSGEWGVVGYYDVIGDTIWFGTNVGRVYKSIDKGFHWTVAQTALAAYIKPSFKDANNGLVIDINGDAAQLAETSDGGTTWTFVDFTGNCYDTDLCYVPGTDNMYISTGASPTGSGGSYSLDGGHSWTEYDAQMGLQMMNLDFIAGKIGWSGAFNTDQTTGGIWKYVPGVAAPAFTIDIVGGKGFTATIKNVGEIDATNVNVAITIEGGFIITPKTFSGTQATLTVGQELVVPGAPKGIGLGIFTPMPKIKVHVTCDQNVTADKSADAKIIITKVNLM